MPLLPASPTRPSPHRRLSRVLAAVAGVCILAGMFLPSPYVIESPGPVFDALGTVRSGTTTKHVIEIRGARTYSTSGSLDVLTVSVLGSPDQQPNWLEVIGAWMRSDTAVTPQEAVYEPGTTTRQAEAENRLMMRQSQQAASAAALRELGYTVPATASVAGFAEGRRAATGLRTGDQIRTVDGVALRSTEQLRRAASRHGSAGTAATLVIRRDGTDRELRIRPAKISGQWVLGVELEWSYQLPVSVTVHLQGVGGPSAGLIFALSMIDRLTPGSLTGGQQVAGTGTMSASGTVGAIGGIRQKMIAASRNGARWFLAPRSNCSEVTGHIPKGMHVVAVRSLAQARKAVQTIASTKSAAGLPTCS